jgi:sugar phosphate isomerase/epimerase
MIPAMTTRQHIHIRCGAIMLGTVSALWLHGTVHGQDVTPAPATGPDRLRFAITADPTDRKRTEWCRREGFQAIEIAAYEGPEAERAAFIKKVEDLKRELGLQICSVHAGWDLLDVTRPGELPTLLRRDLDLAAAVGAPILVIHHSLFAEPERLLRDEKGKPLARETVDRDLLEWPPMLPRIQEGLRVWGEEAHARGVLLALETEVTNSERLLEFLSKANPAYVGICFDAGHAQVSSDAVALARQLAGRTIHAHIHDNFGKGAFPGRDADDAHFPVGVGVIDWEGVLQALHQAGYRGWLNFELDDPRIARGCSMRLQRISDRLGQGTAGTP